MNYTFATLFSIIGSSGDILSSKKLSFSISFLNLFYLYILIYILLYY